MERQILSRRDFLQISFFATTLLFLPEKRQDKLAGQLAHWDKELSFYPERIEEIGKEVAFLAVDRLCRRFEANPNRFKNNVFLLWPKEYVQALAQTSGCIREYKSPLQLGSASIEGDQIYINLNNILYTSPFGKNLRPKPASTLFEVVYHEGNHVLPPFLDLETPKELLDSGNQRLLLVKKRGLRLYGIYNNNHADGKVCYIPYRSEAEETFVQFLTISGLRRLGIPIPENYAYKTSVENFEKGITLPLFGLNYSPLVKHFLASDPDKFFWEIGIRKGYTEEEAKYKGEAFVYRVIKQT